MQLAALAAQFTGSAPRRFKEPEWSIEMAQRIQEQQRSAHVHQPTAPAASPMAPTMDIPLAHPIEHLASVNQVTIGYPADTHMHGNPQFQRDPHWQPTENNGLGGLSPPFSFSGTLTAEQLPPVESAVITASPSQRRR